MLVPQHAMEKRQSGFALIAALSVLAIIVVLLLSIAFFSRIESINAARGLEQLKARESARLALMIAIGVLQKHAGPDSRVTARAEILGSDISNGERYWTGVWDTNNLSNPPIWLVSGNAPDPENPDANSGLLLGASGTDLSGTLYPEQYVSAPLTGIVNPDDRVFAEIAWWISDEGTKASVGRLPLPSRPGLNFFDRAEVDATELQLANMHGVEELFAAYNRFESDDANGQDRVRSVTDLLNLAALSDGLGLISMTGSESPTHALTPGSYGVLANTLPSSDPDAGLMRDLSLYPGLLGDGLEDYLLLGESNESLLSAQGTERLRLFTEILGLEDIGSLNAGDIALPVAPILTNFMIAFTVRSHSPAASNPNFYLRMRFFSEFWNPYTHSLRMVDAGGNPLDLELEITGLPTVTVTKTTGSLDSSAPIDIQSAVGDASKPDTPLVIRLDFDDSVDWLPGQSMNWNGVDATLATGSSPYVSIERFNKFIGDPNHNLGGTTGLETNEPRLTANLRHTSAEDTKIGIKVFLANTNSGTRKKVAEFDGFAYEAVSTRPEGYSNTHSGATFGYHILLRSPHHSSADPEFFRGLWLYDHDPRNFQPQLNPDWYLDNDPLNNQGSAFAPVKDGVSPLPLPIPAEINETDSTIEISDFRRLHDRSLGMNGNLANQLWQDAPLFELPRQRILSMAALQHVYFHGERPFQVGNSWGSQGSTNTSAWFDRYYFSGFSREDDPGNFDTALGPPNPSLMTYPARRGIPLADWQAESADDGEAATEPAKQLMVANRFNLNSTSIDAWTAVLGSLRLGGWEYLDYPDEDTSDLSTLAVGNTNRGGMFARFSHSLQETYDATETPAFVGSEPVAPSAFYRHGARRFTTEQLRDLAEEIVRLIQARGRPFESMEAFMEADASGDSLIEQAIANVLTEDGRQKWHHDWELEGNTNALELPGIDIDHFSPGFLTQADILTAIGPMLATRSDTFRIRATSRTYSDDTGSANHAALEAVLQRTPDPVNSGLPGSPFGRQFKLLYIRWLDTSEL